METRSPYAFKQNEWISFDNTQSLTYKAEYIKEYGFGGAMVYCLNSDDFRGTCKGGPFPLMKSIHSVLYRKNWNLCKLSLGHSLICKLGIIFYAHPIFYGFSKLYWIAVPMLDKVSFLYKKYQIEILWIIGQ